MNKERIIIGIDLGTTNSAVAIMQGGIPIIVKNYEEGAGGATTPSVVFFDENGKKETVGRTAKAQTVIYPKRTIIESKRIIGKRWDSPEVQEFRKNAPFKVVEAKNGDAWIEIAGKEYSPSQIAAFILEKMKETAEKYIGENVEIKRAVITVPAYFKHMQRKATEEAGRIAGLTVERIISEPTAAALAYGVNKSKEPRTVVVFDLGGGTFDISIININEGLFKVKATNGDNNLGGADFDQKIVDWLIKEFKSQQPGNEKIELDEFALQYLKTEAENAKCDLSFMREKTIQLNFLATDASGKPRSFMPTTLSRQKVKEITNDLLERLVEPCKKCLKDANLDKSKIDEVILVGGMTRMPAVQEKVKEIFGKEPNKSVNPDEAVALGAAVQGGIITGESQGIVLTDVLPISLGVEAQGARGGIEKRDEFSIFAKIIPRGTPIPIKKTEIFSNAEDNQDRVVINVLQGERIRASENSSLGRFELMDITRGKKGQVPIEVTFDVDANAILTVTAVDKKANASKKVVITGAGGLSKEEIDDIIKKAEDEKVREKDEEFRIWVETLRLAQDYCQKFEEEIENLRKSKEFQENDSQFQELKEKFANLKEVTDKTTKNLTEENYKEVKEQVDEIEKLMKLANSLRERFSSKEDKNEKDEEVPSGEK